MAGSMETGVRVLPMLMVMVGMFGVTSAVLGFIAESESLAPGDIHVSGSGNECVYPANLAHALGVCAMLLLIVAQIIASAVGVCSQPEGGASKASRRRVVHVGVVVFIVSWIMTVIAVRYYYRGVDWNTPGTRGADYAAGRYEECFHLKGGEFIRAAVLSVLATLLAIKSCFLLHTPAATPEPVEGADEPKPDSAQHPAQGNGRAHGYGQAQA